MGVCMVVYIYCSTVVTSPRFYLKMRRGGGVTIVIGLRGVQLIGLNISKLDRMGRILKAKQNGKKSLLKLLYDNCWFELQQYLCCNQRDCKRDLKWPLMHEKMAILHSQRYPWNLYLINIVDAIVVCKVWKFV